MSLRPIQDSQVSLAKSGCTARSGHPTQGQPDLAAHHGRPDQPPQGQAVASCPLLPPFSNAGNRSIKEKQMISVNIHSFLLKYSYHNLNKPQTNLIIVYVYFVYYVRIIFFFSLCFSLFWHVLNSRPQRIKIMMNPNNFLPSLLISSPSTPFSFHVIVEIEQKGKLFSFRRLAFTQGLFQTF